MAKRAPKRIYLEVWPAGSLREDRVHYQQTGFGVDMMTGDTSRIVTYERVPQKQIDAARKAKRR